MSTAVPDDDDARRRRSAVWTWLGAMAILALIAVTYVVVFAPAGAPLSNPWSDGRGDARAAKHTKPLTISGSVVDGVLAPGVVRNLRVRVTNPNNRAVHVLAINVAVGRSSIDRCPAAWVKTRDYQRPFAAAVRVDAGATVSVNLPIVLRDLAKVDQNACRFALFPLSFKGSARESA